MAIGSVGEFIRLRYSEDPDDYRRAASEPASLDVWCQVVDRYPEARFWVAQNKTVPLEILAILASDPDRRVRSMVARKKRSTSDILAVLADDEDDAIRMSVARHRNTPRDALETLQSERWAQIREIADERLSGASTAGEDGGSGRNNTRRGAD
jgi:hypothetical protein